MTSSLLLRLLRTALVLLSTSVLPIVSSQSSELNQDIYMQESKNIERELTSTMTCPLPKSKERNSYYEADLELVPYFGVNCTDTQLQMIGQELSLDMDSFFANDDSSLGPISLSHNCVDEDLTAASTGVRRNLRSHTYGERSLRTKGMTFLYKGGGRCRYCNDDDDDYNRRQRRLTSDVGEEVAVTVFVETDNFPQEMAVRIESAEGVVYNNSNFANPNSFFEKIINLKRGKSYILVAQDTFGDGWCCKHGKGWAAIILGNGATPLVEIDGEFQAEKKMPFTIPSTSVYFSDTVIPKVEQKVTDYLTTRLWNKHQNNPSSCLTKAGSTVEVKLKALDTQFDCSRGK